VPVSFAPGDAILQRHVWRDEIFLAFSVRVVQDAPDLLVTWLAPGTPYKRPAVRDQLPFHQPLVDRPWTPPGTLQLTRPGAAHSIWIFDHGWYVNLQEPLRRTSLGFDTCDQLLDLVRSREGGWRRKDEDDLAESVRRGFLSNDEAAAIRAEGERVIAADPFPTGWEDWEPDPSWSAPGLPPGWDVL
jgi:uncharacterized protein DUF402